MRTGHLIAALLLAAFGVAAAVAGWRLGIGTATEPGAGFMIVLAGVGTALLGVAIGASAARRQAAATSADSPWAGVDYRRPAIAVGLLVVYAALLEHAGFAVVTVLLLFVLFADGDRARWRGALVCGVVATAITYGVFDRLLGAALPVGRWIERVASWTS